MSKNILIINGHPNGNSYCSALATAYEEGALASGFQVRKIELSALMFETNLKFGYIQRTELEPDLSKSQNDILWANHLVFVYPIWWGTVPALLKGFIDRVFLPGFAFKNRENSPMWDKLLKGKSSRLIVTMDAPSWYYRLVYGSPGHNMMKKAVLQFCGVSPVKATTFSQVKSSTESRRKQWIEQVRTLGKNGQ